ncbi:HD domain-containing protein [Anaeromicropila populeti]|nr:HD domain-containing protein [Anaeromicropila populeti]
MSEMIKYYAGDPKRIQHFIKVHSFSKLIGELEEVPSDVLEQLEAAALVHDIGIKLCEEKYGNCNGKLQEKEGPEAARQLLERVGYSTKIIDRVCYLVGHHHTYNEITGQDYQILVEADFLVNMYEDQLEEKAVKIAFEKIFKTKSGKKICREMFL